MICFAAEIDAATARRIGSFLSVTPFTPAMKKSPGISSNIDEKAHMLARIDAMMCTKKTPTELEEISTEMLKGLVEGQDHTRHHVRRSMEGQHRRLQSSGTVSAECLDFFSSLHREFDRDIVSFTVPREMRDGKYRECLRNMVNHVAAHAKTCFVGVYQEAQTENALAAGITQSGNKDSTPFFSAGLDGEGQIVAVSDTGLDINNCYFWDSQNAAPRDKSGSVKSNARKVVQYYAHADATDVTRGHGSKFGSIETRKSLSCH